MSDAIITALAIFGIVTMFVSLLAVAYRAGVNRGRTETTTLTPPLIDTTYPMIQRGHIYTRNNDPSIPGAITGWPMHTYTIIQRKDLHDATDLLPDRL